MTDECWIEEGLEKSGRSLTEAVSGPLPGGTLKNQRKSCQDNLCSGRDLDRALPV
jgi:hypothetical protein